jgi:hypothetical protein
MSRGRLLGIALLAASPLAAQTTDPFDVKVRNLAHPRYAEREKAARELEAAGEPALKALHEAAQSSDEELRGRAAAVAERIERTARSERLLTAPKVVLRFEKTPLNEAITEFGKKTQIRCELDKSKIKNSDRTVTLDTGEVPYWEAVHAFFEAAGLTEDNSPTDPKHAYNGGRRTRFEESPIRNPGIKTIFCLADGSDSAPMALGSAIRVRAMPANFALNKYDDIRGEVTFPLDLEAVPSLALREIIGIEVRKATAEDGRALVAAYPDPPAAVGLGLNEQFVMQQLLVAANGNLATVGLPVLSAQPVTLKTNGIRPKKLTELQGVVVARVITPPEAIVTVPQLMRPGTHETTADGMTVQVKNVTTGPDNRVVVQVRLVSRMDQSDDVLNVPLQLKGRIRPFIRINRGSGLAGGQLPDFKIHDASGTPIRGLSAQVMGGEFDGTTMAQNVRLSFDRTPSTTDDQLSLVLMGKRAAVVEMPFTLRGVPLGLPEIGDWTEVPGSSRDRSR